MKKKVLVILPAVLFLVLLTGCVPGDGSITKDHPAGFFWGVWHGWIAPISLIIEVFFNKSIRVYETVNSGWLYDFGFYIAIISGFGGLSLFRKNRSSSCKDKK